MTNRWLQFAIVLVALCNVYARPKEDVFPVYRSVDVSKESRYEEKEFVPIATSNNSSHIKKWPGGQGSIDSLDDLMLYQMYTNSRPTAKPTGSLDFFYHTSTTPQNYFQNFYDRFTTPPNEYPNYFENHYNKPKPSIIIIEDVPTRPPYGYPNFNPFPEPPPSPVYSNVLQFRPTTEPTTVSYVPIILGSTVSPIFSPNDEYKPITPPPTTAEIFPQVPTTTKKPKKAKKPKKPKPSKCPNVYINTSSSIVNQNDIKSKCEDITINVDTHLANSNDVDPQVQNSHSTNFVQPLPTTSSRPLIIQSYPEEEYVPFHPGHPIVHHFLKPKPTYTVSVVTTTTPTNIVNDEYEPSPLAPIDNSMTAVINLFGSIMHKFGTLAAMVTLPFMSVAAPLMVLAGGVAMASIAFPWAFPFLNIFRRRRRRRNRGRNRKRNKFILLRNRSDKPEKYSYQRIGENANYLRRMKRDVTANTNPYVLKMLYPNLDLEFLPNVGL